MSVLVVGTVAFDSIETPHGKVERALGGAAIILTLVGLRTLLHLATLAGASKWLKQKDLVFAGVLLEPLVLGINLGIYISNSIVKPQKWN